MLRKSKLGRRLPLRQAGRGGDETRCGISHAHSTRGRLVADDFPSACQKPQPDHGRRNPVGFARINSRLALGKAKLVENPLPVRLSAAAAVLLNRLFRTAGDDKRIGPSWSEHRRH